MSGTTRRVLVSASVECTNNLCMSVCRYLGPEDECRLFKVSLMWASGGGVLRCEGCRRGEEAGESFGKMLQLIGEESK